METNRGEAVERIDAPARQLRGLVERLRSAGALSSEFGYVLGRDAAEVGLCIRDGATKAALILCGGILEGVLTSVLMHNPSIAEREFKRLEGKQHREFPKEASLPDLVKLSRKDLHQGLRPLFREVHEGLAGLINGHRDLVHPHAEIRAEQLPITEHTVSAVLGNLQALLEGIAREIDGVAGGKELRAAALIHLLDQDTLVTCVLDDLRRARKAKKPLHAVEFQARALDMDVRGGSGRPTAAPSASSRGPSS